MLTSLAEPIGPEDAEIPVESASQFPEFGLAWVGNELVSYAGKSGDMLTDVSRGLFGQSPVTHSAGEPVRLVGPDETLLLTIRGIFENEAGLDWNGNGFPDAADLTCSLLGEGCVGSEILPR